MADLLGVPWRRASWGRRLGYVLLGLAGGVFWGLVGLGLWAFRDMERHYPPFDTGQAQNPGVATPLAR